MPRGPRGKTRLSDCRPVLHGPPPTGPATSSRPEGLACMSSSLRGGPVHRVSWRLSACRRADLAALVPKSQRHRSVLKLHRLEFTILVEPRITEFSAVSGFFVSTGGQGEVRIPVRRFALLRTFQLKRALPATTQGSAPLPRGPPMPDSSLLAPWSHFFRRTRDGAWKCITLSSLTSMPHSHQWIGDGSARTKD